MVTCWTFESNTLKCLQSCRFNRAKSRRPERCKIAAKQDPRTYFSEFTRPGPKAAQIACAERCTIACKEGPPVPFHLDATGGQSCSTGVSRILAGFFPRIPGSSYSKFFVPWQRRPSDELPLVRFSPEARETRQTVFFASSTVPSTYSGNHECMER